MALHRYLIKNATIVNEKRIFTGSVVTTDSFIDKIYEGDYPGMDTFFSAEVIEANGKYLFPGVIDSHVHFRDPGLTHKGDIYTESKAAVAGGVTTYMDMPNTDPQTTTAAFLIDKFRLASQKSFANYSFFVGATDKNMKELLSRGWKKAAGLKIFMGSSTGNMLVDDPKVLEKIFSIANIPVVVHCEDEATIKKNLKLYKKKFGDDIPVSCHPLIRSEEACYKSSLFAIELARKYNTRLHLAHVTTGREMELLENNTPAKNKRITAEVCLAHTWFDDSDYEKLGTQIKCNPAIKTSKDRLALMNNLLSGKIDIISSDHAPHTIADKSNGYLNSPSGIPMVQHSLVAMLELCHKGIIPLEVIIEKMCHNPAEIFGIEKRGFIKPGYHADLVLVDMDSPWKVNKNNLWYKCNWSPFEGVQFKSRVTHTFVNGRLAYNDGKFNESVRGGQLIFNR